MGQLTLRGGTQWLWCALFLAVSPQIFWARSLDVGRADILVCSFMVWSVIAAIGERFWLAAPILVAGSLVHATAIVFGGPMLVALSFVIYRQGKARLLLGAAAEDNRNAKVKCLNS